MPSQLDDLFSATALPLLLQYHGEDVVYQKPPNDPSPMTGIVRWLEGAEEFVRKDGRRLATRADVDLPASLVPTPELGDVVTLASEQFRVDRVPSPYRAGFVTVHVVLIATRDYGKEDRLLPTR